jgi:O-acetylhomoserine (thiol)-lyase
MQENYRPDTLCIHAGYSPKNGEPRVVPIVQSTTYRYDSAESMGRLFNLEEDGFFYTRISNPTTDAVEKKIAALEGGVGCVATSSGMAAIFLSVLNICKAGDHIVSSNAVYGGTFNLFNKTMRDMGIDTTFVSPDSTEEELEKAMQPNTRAVYCETLCNPSLVVTNLELFAKVAHAHGVPLIVDNTFPTPLNCRPFSLWCGYCCTFHVKIYGRPRGADWRRNYRQRKV